MSTESDRKRPMLECLIWTLLALLCSIQLANLGIQITFAAKYTSKVNLDGLEFALYKNSRFQECASHTPPPTLDCTIINGQLFEGSIYKDYVSEGQSYLNQLNYYSEEGNAESGIKHTWCELASCLKDYRVIPSKPRDSAYTFTGIEHWSYLIMGILDLWALRKEFVKGANCPDGCKERKIGVMDWVGVVGSAGAVGLWCYFFVVLARDPGGASPVSILAWVTPWTFAYATRYHPIVCVLDAHPLRKKALRGVLIVGTLAGWSASCYVLSLEYYTLARWLSHDPRRRYDCVDACSMEVAVPGTLPQCSPQQLCAKDWLFKDPGLSS